MNVPGPLGPPGLADLDLGGGGRDVERRSLPALCSMGLCLIVLAMCVVIASQKWQQTPCILLITLSRLAVEHVVQTPCLIFSLLPLARFWSPVRFITTLLICGSEPNMAISKQLEPQAASTR